MPSLRAALFLAIAGLGACSSTSTLPGTSLGSFALTGNVSSNTCGSGLGAPDTLTFDVAISKKSSVLYWRESGGETYSGVLDANNATTITSTVTSQTGDEAGTVQCTTARTDSVAVTLDSATSPTKLSGTIGFAFAITSGTCSGELRANGGTYDTLPCQASYTFTATKK